MTVPPLGVAITGATGFLGGRLAAALRRAGRPVLGIRRPGALPVGPDSVAADDPALGERLRFCSVLVHAATCYGRRGESEEEIERANVEIPLAILEVARGAGIERIVNLGTGLPDGVNAYASSKHRFSRSLTQRVESSGISAFEAVLQHFYDADAGEGNFLVRTARACLGNEPRLPLTDGQQRRDFVHANDVVDAILSLVLDHPLAPGAAYRYDIGSGHAPTVRSVVERIATLSETTTTLDFGAVQRRPGEPDCLVADITPLTAVTGWQPRITLDQGLYLLVDRLRSHDSCAS